MMADVKARWIQEFLEQHKDGYSESDLRGTNHREVLEALVEERKNILHWIDFDGKRVLLIGTRYGVYTNELLASGASVWVLESDAEEATLMEQRFGETEALTILREEAMVWKLSETFDWIILPEGFANAGVRQLASHVDQHPAGTMSLAAKQYVGLLKKLQTKLTSGGRILLWNDNRMGMKYFATTKAEEIPFGEFSGVYPAAGQTRFTRKELEGIFGASGLQAAFYYPFPDAIFPEFLFSDRHLPTGEDYLNNGLAWNEGMRLFQEHGGYETVLAEGLFPQFASSFLCVLQEGESFDDLADYVKYSTRRNRRFAISTEVYRPKNQRGYVRKRAFFPEGELHISHMMTLQKELAGAVANTKFLPCMYHSTKRTGDLDFDFALGTSFDAQLDALVFAGQGEKAKALIQKFVEELLRAANRNFEVTEEFQGIFLGEEVWPEDESDVSLSVTDIDLIFANVICENEKWWIIDYEWTFSFPIPFCYLIYRCLFYYFYANPKRREFLSEEELYEQYGITQTRRALYAKMEEQFQSYIFGGYLPLYREDGYGNALPTGREVSAFVPEVYEDFGDGFDPAGCRKIVSEVVDDKHVVNIPVSDGTQLLRMDPAGVPGFLEVLSVTEEAEKPLSYSCMGEVERFGDTYLFRNDDPQLIIYTPPGVQQVRVCYRFVGLFPVDEASGPLLPQNRGAMVAAVLQHASGITEGKEASSLGRRLARGFEKARQKRLVAAVRRMHRREQKRSR